MKNLTWQNPEQLFVAQELINKVESKCCGIKVHLNSTNRNFYSQPVEIGLHTDEDITAAGYKLWLQASENCWRDVILHGTYTQDSIVIYNETFPYVSGSIVFYREPIERIKSYNRDLINPDLERENNINTLKK